MSGLDVFLALLKTGRRPVPRRERGPFPEAPSAQEDDLAFVLGEHTRRKWSDAQFTGPGAAEAEARRAASLGLTSKVEAQALDHPPKRRRLRVSKRERLELRLERLRADVEILESANGKQKKRT